MRYQANRGGHAPGHLREWFEQYLDAGQKITGDLEQEMVAFITRRKLQRRGKSLEAWLLGQLWDCRDIMPSDMRTQVADLAASPPFTYGQAVRALKARLEREPR
jgi:hypothetical protein